MDSKGYEVPGGQGQDFNLNWLIHAGVRFRTAHAWWASLGLYFQHISNRGLNKINPGLNALGPTLGLSRKF
jgi:lipid A 3-O-deacylase